MRIVVNSDDFVPLTQAAKYFPGKKGNERISLRALKNRIRNSFPPSAYTHPHHGVWTVRLSYVKGLQPVQLDNGEVAMTHRISDPKVVSMLPYIKSQIA